jgi:formate dehydrogenase subunit beta
MVYRGEMYYAWAADRTIRVGAQNGGLITSLLFYLLDTQRIDAAVVMREGIDVYEVVPVVITSAEDLTGTAGTFIAGGEILAPLVVEYCAQHPGDQVAVVCKGCDAKSIYELMKRNRITSDNITLIGVTCSGTFSPVLLEQFVQDQWGLSAQDVTWIGTHYGKLVVKGFHDGEEKQFTVTLEDAQEHGLAIHDWCMRCDAYMPRQCDMICGSLGVSGKLAGFVTFVEICTDKGAKILTQADTDRAIWLVAPEREGIDEREIVAQKRLSIAIQNRDTQFENFGRKRERLETIMRETARCIRCGQCVKACPLCVCRDCSIKKEWLVVPDEVPPPFMYHLIRFSHIADSCVNCGQCELRCPTGIPNSLFTHAAQLELEYMFGYKPGTAKGIPQLSKVYERDCFEYRAATKNSESK